MRVKFNINDNVYVILTNHGRETLRQFWVDAAQRMDKPVFSVLDNQYPGWQTDTPIRFQLHHLMEIFGKDCEAQAHSQTTIPFHSAMEIDISSD